MHGRAMLGLLAIQLVAFVVTELTAETHSQLAPPGGDDVVLEFEHGSAWEKYSYPDVCTAAGRPIGPDSMPIAWHHRPTNTSYFMVADHRHMYAGTGSSLDNLSGCSASPVFTSANDSTPQSYANFQWLQSVRVFADGTAAGLVHNEFKGEFPADTGPQYCSRHCADSSPVNASGCRDEICEIWSTGLVRSAADSATFQLVAPPPHHLVAALPHRYRKDENLTGFGAISNGLQRGEDAAFYGSINVVNQCSPGSTLCGDTAAGNCLFRATNLTDPTSFRARDRDGEFTVRWTSAYSPTGEGTEHACATLPVSEIGQFGSHISFRKIVLPEHSMNGFVGKPPTYIALGDASPAVGHVKYSLTYQRDFGAAMRGHINASWTPPKFLDLSSAWRWLDGDSSGNYGSDQGSRQKSSKNDNHSMGSGGMKYFYPTLLDVRSPELGVLAGSVAAQEDGDSYALVSFPRHLPPGAPPTPGPIDTVRVAGAGCNECNGVYKKAAVPPGFGSASHLFARDAKHSIYMNDGVWHLAQLGVKVFYMSSAPASSGGGPPATGWKVVSGMKPAPSSVAGIHGPSVANTSISSLYLFLRGSEGIMRRKVQLRNAN